MLWGLGNADNRTMQAVDQISDLDQRSVDGIVMVAECHYRQNNACCPVLDLTYTLLKAKREEKNGKWTTNVKDDIYFFLSFTSKRR